MSDSRSSILHLPMLTINPWGCCERRIFIGRTEHALPRLQYLSYQVWPEGLHDIHTCHRHLELHRSGSKSLSGLVVCIVSTYSCSWTTEIGSFIVYLVNGSNWSTVLCYIIFTVQSCGSLYWKLQNNFLLSFVSVFGETVSTYWGQQDS